MIELHDVEKRLGERRILAGLTFQVPRGKTYVLMGRSGTGKSVTLKHVIGILRPDRGSVRVDGMEVPDLDARGLMQLRKRMGYLFQNGALINWLTVAQNVALPLQEHNRISRGEVADRVMEALKMVGMDHAADLLPARISGGMKLRTGLARALVTEPAYVLYDEPNAGLDPIMSDQIHELIVTHSRACATTVGNFIGILDEGRIVAEGTVEQMLASQEPLVRSFLGHGSD